VALVVKERFFFLSSRFAASSCLSLNPYFFLIVFSQYLPFQSLPNSLRDVLSTLRGDFSPSFVPRGVPPLTTRPSGWAQDRVRKIRNIKARSFRKGVPRLVRPFTGAARDLIVRTRSTSGVTHASKVTLAEIQILCNCQNGQIICLGGGPTPASQARGHRLMKASLLSSYGTLIVVRKQTRLILAHSRRGENPEKSRLSEQCLYRPPGPGVDAGCTTVGSTRSRRATGPERRLRSSVRIECVENIPFLITGGFPSHGTI